jgi:hypothetical protein
MGQLCFAPQGGLQYVLPFGKHSVQYGNKKHEHDHREG